MEEPIRLVPEVGPEIRAGYSGDFEDLFAEHHQRLFGALVIVTGDRGEADDLTQDAFVRVLERWGRVSAMEDPVGYLYRTAMNLFRKRYRRQLRGQRLIPDTHPPVDALAEVEDRDAVLGAMAKLPIDQRAALIVTTLFGYSSEEAAQILRTSASNVRSRATRARAAIRAGLEANG